MSKAAFPLRLFSSVLLIAVFLGTVHYSGPFWLACLLVCQGLTFMALHEMLGMLKRKGVRIFEAYTLMGGMVLTAAVFFSSFPVNLSGDLVTWSLVVWILGLFLLHAARPTPEGAIVSLFSGIGAMLYVVALFGFLIKINYLEGIDGRLYVYYIFLVVFAGDIAAYAIGSSMGRHPLAPSISPKKTIEGGLAGLATAAAVSLLAQSLFLPNMPLWHALGLGLVLGLVAQIGDLWESLMKRDADVKDSGTSIPGIGGVLDLLDGLLWCAPIVYLYLKRFVA